jgi:hypothetical protein
MLNHAKNTFINQDLKQTVPGINMIIDFAVEGSLGKIEQALSKIAISAFLIVI